MISNANICLPILNSVYKVTICYPESTLAGSSLNYLYFMPLAVFLTMGTRYVCWT